jgi:hypothetical protein
MFIGKYELEGKEYFAIYYKNKYGYDEWHKDTFSPTCENIETLDFKIGGKTYQEKKANLEELAKDWQYNFCSLSWSYGELAEIQGYFYENAKRYGLVKVFRENAIC